jgi:hypothetical protein
LYVFIYKCIFELKLTYIYNQDKLCNINIYVKMLLEIIKGKDIPLYNEELILGDITGI